MQKGARLSSYKIINDTGLRFCKCHFFPWKVLIPFLCAVFILRYLHQWLRWGDKVEKQKKVIFWHSTRFTSGKFFSAFSSHFFFASLRYSSSLAISVFFWNVHVLLGTEISIGNKATFVVTGNNDFASSSDSIFFLLFPFFLPLH